MGRQREKTTTKSRREALEGTNSADTLDFQYSELRENKFPLFKALSLCYRSPSKLIQGFTG